MALQLTIHSAFQSVLGSVWHPTQVLQRGRRRRGSQLSAISVRLAKFTKAISFHRKASRTPLDFSPFSKPSTRPARPGADGGALGAFGIS